jgi:hypothetical protein
MGLNAVKDLILETVSIFVGVLRRLKVSNVTRQKVLL